MAIPATGPVRMSDINTELGRPSTALINLDRAENGAYGTINQNSPSRPNGTNPARMSEWRGYDHNAGSGNNPEGPYRFGYDEGSADQSCINFIGGRLVERYLTAGFNEGNWFEDACQLFIPGKGGFAFAPAGFYSRDEQYRQWGGSGWIDAVFFCRI